MNERGLRFWLPRIGGGILLFFGVAAAMYLSLEAWPDVETFESDEAGISLRYSGKLQAPQLSEQDKTDKVLLRLQQPADEQAEFLITARYEGGLKQVSTAAKQELQDALLSNINKSYPGRFPEYNQLSTRNFEVDGHKASEIIFTYKGPADELVKQRFVFVIPSDDMAVYLSAQTTESNYDYVNTEYFDPIFNSLKVN